MGFFLLIALATAGACAGGRKGAQQIDRSLIAETEIRSVAQGTSVTQIVQRYRPEWLRGRGRTTIRGRRATLMVYVNDQRTVDMEMLNSLTAEQVREIRFLDAVAATQRFGTDHGAGALMIILR